MKCDKCGEEVVVQPGKSANFCSNCGNKIEAEKASGWKYFDNTKDLLAHIATEYGLDALFSKKYLSDHAAPSLPQGHKRLVSEAFSCDAVKILQNNINADQKNKEIAVKQAVKRLTDLMFSQEAAERVIWEFTNAIGWGMAEPKSSSVPTQPEQSKSASNTAPLPILSTQTASGTDALMTRAWIFAEDGDWKDAADYFNKVLDIAPTYAPAYLGLLCVDLKASRDGKLANAEKPTDITGHKYYKRAVTDPAIKAQLDGYIQTINVRIDAERKAAEAEAERKRKSAEEAARRKRVQDAFDNADKIMKAAKSPEDYRKAITAFGSIDSNYQDISSEIKNKVAECERLKYELEEAARKKQAQTAFDNACVIMDSAQCPNDYRKAITAFSSIDSSFQDINNQIKTKITECENKKAVIEAEYKNILGRFSAANKIQAKERRIKEAQERLDAENAKTKTEVEAKCLQIRQKFDAEYKAWQEAYTCLKSAYDTEYRKWESEVSAVRATIESRNSQGLCPHCGGTFKSLLTKKCNDCGKSPSDPIRAQAAPSQPNYPAEPRMPQLPTYTPRQIAPALNKVDSDIEAYVDGDFLLVKSDGTTWRVVDVQDGKTILLSDIGSKATLEGENINIVESIFVGEPYSFGGINWLVLTKENNKALLIAEKILEKRPYHQPGGDVAWETCTLRRYLNNEFYNKLGTAKRVIADTQNTNLNNPWYNTVGGNTTIDKVFLLSLNEVVKYFGDSGELRNRPKGDVWYIDDSFSSARVAKNHNGEEASEWWLRSPGEYRSNAVAVGGTGGISMDGIGVDLTNVGVRPALWLNL